MTIIIKFLIKNISEKKFRTFLIVFSITMSSALFFASSAISGTMEKMFMDRLKQYNGSAEIIIHSNAKSPGSFFSTSGAEAFKDRLQYAIGSSQLSGEYKIRQGEADNISLLGFRYEDIQLMNPFTLQAENNLLPFTGNKIILNKPMSKKYNLRVGDMMDLTIRENKYKFEVCAISDPVGPFVDDGRTVCAVVPRDTLSNIYGAKGKASILYIKTKNPQEKSTLLEELSAAYNRYTVREPFSKEELAQWLGPMATSFMLMTIIVFIISIFIIYSSFKVVTAERLPIIGTFRSIGATRKMTDIVLLAESLVYGVVGGLAGCIFGIGILFVMAYTTKPSWVTGFTAGIHFTTIQLAGAFITAVALSVFSSLLPIIKVSKISVKDIVLNNIERKKSRKAYKLVLGFVLLAASALLPSHIPHTAALYADVACMVLSIVSVILLIPFLTNGTAKLFEKLYILLFGNVGYLAAKNLKDNKNIIGNISLLCIGISALLMINTLSYSVGIEVMNVYNDLDFDIWMNYGRANESFESRLKSIDGVKETYGIYGASNVSIKGKNDKIFQIQGIDRNKHPDFWRVEYQGDRNELFDALESERSMLLSDMLKTKFSVKKGDILTLKTPKGDIDYKVAGFFNSLMENGNIAMMAEKYLKTDMEKRYFLSVFIKTDQSPEEVEKAIKKKFKRDNFWISTMDRMETNNMKSNAQMFAILNGFSIMALVIGVFGVLNNYVISFIERRRSLAVLRSIGMNKKQILKMIFIESLTGGFIGGIFGIITGLLLLYNIGYVLKAMNLPVTLHYVTVQFLLSLIGGVLISLIASIGPSVKSSKLNIIESIKYE